MKYLDSVHGTKWGLKTHSHRSSIPGAELLVYGLPEPSMMRQVADENLKYWYPLCRFVRSSQPLTGIPPPRHNGLITNVREAFRPPLHPSYVTRCDHLVDRRNSEDPWVFEQSRQRHEWDLVPGGRKYTSVIIYNLFRENSTCSMLHTKSLARSDALGVKRW